MTIFYFYKIFIIFVLFFVKNILNNENETISLFGFIEYFY